MNRPPDAAELSPLAVPSESHDPELEALPEPRRPGRTLTLACMLLTALVAAALAFSMRGEAVYALRSGPPGELGNLAHFEPRPSLANHWVHGEALLGSTNAIRYSRPLESDSYRLAPVAGNQRLWVQIRVPEGMEGPQFVPPTSFVGRLIPIDQTSLRHGGLAGAVEHAGAGSVPGDAWLLIDGEAPSTTRWALGLIALLLGFVAFNLYGLFRLLRPVRD
jgi:hypothetical protein